jgi:prepilin-type N-terminal cleavage/methylation domain-containing protein
MKPRARTRWSAFSLIEVMVSVGILAVGIAATLSTFSSLLATHEHQENATVALHVAEGTMEELLVRYADDAELASGPHTGATYSREGNAGGSFFATDWEVALGRPFAGAREVTVRVRWTERGVAKSLSIRTVRT